MICIQFIILSALLAQTAGLPSMDTEAEGMTFQELVNGIIAKDQPDASDYRKFADGTLQIGAQLKQNGQALPDPVIHDGLDAVEAGRKANPFAADWEELEAGLLDLLAEKEEPPPQQQPEQENSEEEQESDEPQQQESGDSSSESSDSSEQQPSEPSQSEESQQGSEGQNQEPQDSQNSSGQQEEQQQDQTQAGAEIGDLSEEEAQESPTPSQEASEPQQQMQQIGGQQGDTEEIDADNALVLQKLEQVKQQDDPAKLFQILQEARSGQRKKQQPNTKDW